MENGGYDPHSMSHSSDKWGESKKDPRRPEREAEDAKRREETQIGNYSPYPGENSAGVDWEMERIRAAEIEREEAEFREGKRIRPEEEEMGTRDTEDEIFQRVLEESAKEAAQFKPQSSSLGVQPAPKVSAETGPSGARIAPSGSGFQRESDPENEVDEDEELQRAIEASLAKRN